MWLDFRISTTLSHLTPEIFPVQTRHCTAQINIAVSTDPVCTMNYQKSSELLWIGNKIIWWISIFHWEPYVWCSYIFSMQTICMLLTYNYHTHVASFILSVLRTKLYVHQIIIQANRWQSMCFVLFCTVILSLEYCTVGCGFWRETACKLYTFTKQLMGGAPRTYACIQTSEVETPFTAKAGSWRSTKMIYM